MGQHVERTEHDIDTDSAIVTAVVLFLICRMKVICDYIIHVCRPTEVASRHAAKPLNYCILYLPLF